jgi:hypothetical protein
MQEAAMLDVYHGREPERWWLMRRAATLLLVGPLVMGALLYAVIFHLLPALPLWPVMVLLLAAFGGYLTLGLYSWLRHWRLRKNAVGDRSGNQVLLREHPDMVLLLLACIVLLLLAGVAINLASPAVLARLPEQFLCLLGLAAVRIALWCYGGRSKKAMEARLPVAWYWRWPVLVGLGAAAVATVPAWLVVITTLVNVARGEAILVIQVNEPFPEVYVDRKKVAVPWREGGKTAEIDVKAGRRYVELTKVGFSYYAEALPLREGGRELLQVKLRRENR